MMPLAPAARSFEATFPLTLTTPVTTTIDVETDVWNALEYYSEVEEFGLAVVQGRLPSRSDHHEIFKSFQAFVRQAKSYYSSAKTLHYRSSSLLYYYAFLNLVKAFLVLKDPDSIKGQKIMHGLSYNHPSTPNKDFSLEAVTVSNSTGAFPLFYKGVMGRSNPTKGFAFTIVDLLAYCSTIGYQYGLAGLGQTKIIPSLAAIAMNQPTQEAWTLLAISSFDRVDATQQLKQQLMNAYEEIALPAHLAHTVFGLNAFAYLNQRFFQTIIPDKFLPSGALNLGEVAGRLTTALRPYMGISPYDDGSNFQVVLPLGIGPTETPISQDIAIYVIMFYLSSLVRYQPAYLEELLDHKPAWLIESFVNSTPETFLRIIVSRITNNRLVFRRS